MILYKNVDICDLKSIMEKGILSLDACGNNNWDDGKRGENSTSVVYLFQPLTKENSFPEYGAALLEIDCSADRSEMPDFDVHKGKYEEYITEQVLPSQIRRIFIPSHISKPPQTLIYAGAKWKRITMAMAGWKNAAAKYWNNLPELRLSCPQRHLIFSAE